MGVGSHAALGITEKILIITELIFNLLLMKYYREPYKYYVYIMASKRNGTLYVGVTNDIARRALEHKTNMNKNSFTARYGVHNLVYMEICDSSNAAIEREKQIKSWSRHRKIELIESMNPDWADMFEYLNN